MKKTFTLLFAAFLLLQTSSPLFATSVAVPPVTPEITDPDTTTCPTFTMNLFRGNTDLRTNGAVSDLQEVLAKRYNVDADTLVTGFFGPKTQSYVRLFQRDNYIQQTGTVGPATRAALNRLCVTGGGGGGPVACTMDARMCPDGSYVGRTPPSCEFARCP